MDEIKSFAQGRPQHTDDDNGEEEEDEDDKYIMVKCLSVCLSVCHEK